MFDLITAVGSVDQSLAGDLRGLLKARTKIEIDGNRFKIDEVTASEENHSTYTGELYSLIVPLT